MLYFFGMEEIEQSQTPSPSTPETIDAGDILLSWDTWEYPPIERSGRWYAFATVGGLFCLVYAMFTANYIFAVIVVMFAIIIMMRDMRKPDPTQVYITTEGLVFLDRLYLFKEIRDFSITYDPPTVKNLYLTFNVGMRPMLSIPLEEANPNLVRASLLPFVYENLARDGETLTDTLRRVYKL
jgi:hypothetical protein